MRFAVVGLSACSPSLSQIVYWNGEHWRASARLAALYPMHLAEVAQSQAMERNFEARVVQRVVIVDEATLSKNGLRDLLRKLDELLPLDFSPKAV